MDRTLGPCGIGTRDVVRWVYCDKDSLEHIEVPLVGEEVSMYTGCMLNEAVHASELQRMSDDRTRGERDNAYEDHDAANES